MRVASGLSFKEEDAVEEGGAGHGEGQAEEAGVFALFGFGGVVDPVGSDEGGDACGEGAEGEEECEWVVHRGEHNTQRVFSLKFSVFSEEEWMSLVDEVNFELIRIPQLEGREIFEWKMGCQIIKFSNYQSGKIYNAG